MLEKKICTICGNEFIPKNKKQHICSAECRREYAKIQRKIWDEAHKERVSANKKRYHRENKELISKKNKIYREKHNEELLAYQKEYRANNKEKISARNKIYREKNKEKLAEKNKKYYQENKEKIESQRREYSKKNASKLKEYQKWYNKVNKDRISERNKKYYQEHKEYLKQQRNERTKYRTRTDPNFRMSRLCRKYVYRCLNNKKKKRTEEILGYSFNELKEHIESQFYNGMNWEVQNWEIHHIRPLDTFNFLNEDGTDNYEVIKEANCLDNLIPLFKEDHRRITTMYISEKKYLSREEIQKMFIGDKC